MSFKDRDYELHLVLGDPAAPALWRWEIWQPIAHHLDPVFRAARGPAGATSLQEDTPKHNISFGRLGWNEKSHQKWTHGSPATGERSSTWKFMSTEVWAPTRGACAREVKPPDVFLFLRNEGYWDDDGLTFSPSVLLAIAADLPDAVRDAADLAAGIIADGVRAKLRAFRRRPWAYAFGPQMMTDSIQDIVHTSLFKPGPVRKQRPTIDILTEPWELR
jgi:hypothetical protein